MLAIKFTVEKAQFYLTKPFKVFTDCAALKTLLKIKSFVSNRLTRWAAFLSTYSFSVEYLPGARNKIADYLSRLPNYESPFKTTEHPQLLDIDRECEELRKIIKKGEPIEIYSNYAPVLAIVRDSEYEPIIDRDVILAAQLEDDFVKQTKEALSRDEGHTLGYSVDLDGLLYKDRSTGERHDKLVVPKTLRKHVLKLCHDNPTSGGHGGVARTQYRICQNFYWPGIHRDVEQFCRACETCNAFKPDLHKKKAPLKHMITPALPGEMAAIDVCGPFCLTERGNKYVLSYQDMFTRYIEFIPITDCTAETVARAYVQQIVTRLGLSLKLICDNGSCFNSATFKKVAELLGVKMLFTLAYRPTENSRLERQHSVLGKILASYVNTSGDDWDEFVPFAALISNTSVNVTTNQTPMFLHLGRDINMNYHLLVKPRKIDYSVGTDYAADMVARMQITYEKVLVHQAEEMRKSKLQYDKRTADLTYKIGDVVYAKNHALVKGINRKFQKKFLGPYRITKKFGDATFEIKQIYGRKTMKVHADRLKRALPPGAPFLFDYNSLDAQETTSKSRVRGRTRQYLSASSSDESSISDLEVNDQVVIEPLQPQHLFDKPSVNTPSRNSNPNPQVLETEAVDVPSGSVGSGAEDTSPPPIPTTEHARRSADFDEARGTETETETETGTDNGQRYFLRPRRQITYPK